MSLPSPSLGMTGMALFVFNRVYPTTIEEIKNLDKVEFYGDVTKLIRPPFLAPLRLSSDSLPFPKPRVPFAHPHPCSQKCRG